MSDNRSLSGSPSHIIRKGRIQDAPAIVCLLRELGYPTTQRFVTRMLQTINTKPHDRVIVATICSRVVGVASLHIVPLLHQRGNLCRVTSLVVTEKHRNKGVGRSLMAYAEKFAHTHDCIKIEITSGDQRQGAHRFYKKLGYHEVSRRFLKVMYYREH